MVKTVSVCFTDRTNSGNTFHSLDAGRSLLSFSEFDFTFFWEQAIDAGRQAKRTGQLPKATAENARAAISKCHPYVEAAIGGDYKDIVLDCIIDYITKSERMTEDELWTRCIASKIPYEIAIFERISEYKTFRGTNQWTNISGLQKYARDKIAFIYGDSSDERNTSLRAHTLKQYFDLSFSIAANECSIPKKALPTVKIYNPCLAPTAAFAVSSGVAKSMYKRMEEQLENVPDRGSYEKYNTDILEDKFAVESYSYAGGLARPQEPEEELFRTAMEHLPDKMFVVSSLKGIIDLEFDIMSEQGIHFKKCETCGRYFLINATGFGDRFCDRINSSGKTCKQNYDELCAQIMQTRPAGLPIPAPKIPPVTGAVPENYGKAGGDTDYGSVGQYYSGAEDLPEPPPYEPPPAVNTQVAAEDLIDEPGRVDKTEYFPDLGETVHIRYSAPKRDDPPAEIPEADERHGQKLYNSIYKRVGKAISDTEFREWSQYLSNMKRNVKTGEGNIEQLRQFLRYSDKLAEEIKIAARQKRVISSEPVARLTRFAQLTDNMHSIGDIPFPEYGVNRSPDQDYRAYYGNLPSNMPPETAPQPTAEPVNVIHAADIPAEEVKSFAPDNFDTSISNFQAEPRAGFRTQFREAAAGLPAIPGGNVKVKDVEDVEIDGRRATMGNPVWERVSRDEKQAGGGDGA